MGFEILCRPSAGVRQGVKVLTMRKVWDLAASIRIRVPRGSGIC